MHWNVYASIIRSALTLKCSGLRKGAFFGERNKAVRGKNLVKKTVPHVGLTGSVNRDLFLSLAALFRSL
jgi:hypothetical protein